MHRLWLLALVALVAACGSVRKWSKTPAEIAATPAPPPDLLASLCSADDGERIDAVAALRAGGFVPRGTRVAGFVDVAELDPTILVDMVFFTGRNYLDHNFYGINTCFVREELGRALAAASAQVRAQGYRLVVRDCYRPLAVQRALVAAPSYDGIAASLANANHPRGAAVDARLARPDGRKVPLAPRGVPVRQVMASDAPVGEPYASGRRTLREAMLAAGLKPIRREYWHFDVSAPRRYPQLDVPVAAMAKWERLSIPPLPRTRGGPAAQPPPPAVSFVPADPDDRLGAAW